MSLSFDQVLYYKSFKRQTQQSQPFHNNRLRTYGNIPQLEKELHTARGREYRETLPAPVLTIQPSWEPKANFLIEKVTSKRIYLTTIVGNDFYVSRDGSDSWSRTWGLDIPATIAVWQNFLANNSPTRKPD